MVEVLFPTKQEVQIHNEQKLREKQCLAAIEKGQEVLLAYKYLPVLKSRIVEDYLNSERTYFFCETKFTEAFGGPTPFLREEFSCVMKYHTDDLVKWALDQRINLNVSDDRYRYVITCTPIDD